MVLYRDPDNSHLSMLGVTGGADWVDPTVLSMVFRVDATNPSLYSNLLTLAPGERVYAVPTIYGNSAYFITSKGNLQGATAPIQLHGSLIRIGLGATPSVTTLASVKQGAAEVAVDATATSLPRRPPASRRTPTPASTSRRRRSRCRTPPPSRAALAPGSTCTELARD